MIPSDSPKHVKKWKRRMAGSPKEKRQYKLSPSYNRQIKMYKKSREKSKERSREDKKNNLSK